MTCGRGLAHEFGDRNDLVAAGAERVDEHGQSGEGGCAISTAIVHEDDRAAELRLLLHDARLVKYDVAWISCGLLRGCSSQSSGVDLVADDGVAYPWMRSAGAA